LRHDLALNIWQEKQRLYQRVKVAGVPDIFEPHGGVRLSLGDTDSLKLLLWLGLRLLHVKHPQSPGAIVLILEKFVSNLVKRELILDNPLDCEHILLELVDLIC
jgi:hypothetical protein